MALRKSLLPLLLASLLGLGAAIFAQNWMTDRIARMEAEKLNGLPVVIAAREIPFGEKIALEDLKVIGWPHGNVPEGTYSETAEVLGKVANQKILPGEPVLKGRAVNMGGGSSLAAQIEPSMRAVTVRVNDVIGVGGFLLPGNRVDVLATRMVDQQKRAQTRTLLSNVKVLAVDQTAMAEKDKPVVVRAVTLEVDPKQAEKLVQATEEGTVQMALRNPEDSSVIDEPETVAVSPPVAVQPRPRPKIEVSVAPPPPAEAQPVTVIRQTQVGKSAD